MLEIVLLKFISNRQNRPLNSRNKTILKNIYFEQEIETVSTKKTKATVQSYPVKKLFLKCLGKFI